jgi:DNA-binding transcriptional regulator of glucitol operon
VLRRFSFALRPGWVLFHLIVVAVSVTMVLLGRWQLRVSEHKHFSIQNFGYAIQWWLFTAFALLLWWRVLRDAARRRAIPAETSETLAEPTPVPTEQVAYRRYVMPPARQPSVDDDPVRVAYNDYLASLAASDAEEQT